MSQQNSDVKWHAQSTTVALLIIFLWPIGLFLMWKNSVWTGPIRLIITVLLMTILYFALIWRPN
jgi:hypothetical protein